jgi:UDP-N-acetylmuramate dehydrogenase
MIQIQENISLKPYNTFGLDVKGRFFVRISNLEDVSEVYSKNNNDFEKKLIIGGGSNILLLSDFDGMVIKNEIKGIEKIRRRRLCLGICWSR